MEVECITLSDSSDEEVKIVDEKIRKSVVIPKRESVDGKKNVCGVTTYKPQNSIQCKAPQKKTVPQCLNKRTSQPTILHQALKQSSLVQHPGRRSVVFDKPHSVTIAPSVQLTHVSQPLKTTKQISPHQINPPPKKVKPLPLDPPSQLPKKEMKLEITKIYKMDLENASRIEVTDVCSLDSTQSPDVIVLNVSQPKTDVDDDDGIIFLGEFKPTLSPPIDIESEPETKPKKESLSSEDSPQNSGSFSDDHVDKTEENKEVFHQLCMLTLSAKEGCQDFAKAHSKLRKYFENADTEVIESETLFTLLNESKVAVEQFMKGEADLVRTIHTIQEVINCLKENNALITKKVKRLEKMLAKVNRRIMKLEEMEVDSEDEFSPYVQLDRYRKRAVDIHNKICSLLDCPTDAERASLRKLTLSDQVVPLSIQRALEKYYNRTKKFPDYVDVLRIVRYVINKQDLKLGVGEDETFAKRMFTEIGETLQMRRKYDDYIIMSEYATADMEDPAEKDPELLTKLMSNKANYIRKEREVLEKYARAQEEKALEKRKKIESKADEEAKSGEEDNDDSSDQESVDEDRLNMIMDKEDNEENFQPLQSDAESECQSDGSDDSSSSSSNPPNKKLKT